MELACLDLEGVLVPEIWIAFAEKTGIEELRATTRGTRPFSTKASSSLERPVKPNT